MLLEFILTNVFHIVILQLTFRCAGPSNLLRDKLIYMTDVKVRHGRRSHGQPAVAPLPPTLNLLQWSKVSISKEYITSSYRQKKLFSRDIVWGRKIRPAQ